MGRLPFASGDGDRDSVKVPLPSQARPGRAWPLPLHAPHLPAPQVGCASSPRPQIWTLQHPGRSQAISGPPKPPSWPSTLPPPSRPPRAAPTPTAIQVPMHEVAVSPSGQRTQVHAGRHVGMHICKHAYVWGLGWRPAPGPTASTRLSVRDGNDGQQVSGPLSRCLVGARWSLTFFAGWKMGRKEVLMLLQGGSWVRREGSQGRKQKAMQVNPGRWAPEATGAEAVGWGVPATS